MSLWKLYGLPEPVAEYRFAPPRKFRFDFCWPKKSIAVEVEGGIWTQGRHTRGKGYLSDMSKYNLAAKAGYRVFRFTPKQYENGEAQAFMKEVL
jgi:very-short-patch-repair endonuclease